MKLAHFFFVSALAISALTSPASGEDKAAPEPVQRVVTIKAPFDNYWDAKVWEPGSSDFWNASSGDAPAKTKPAREKTPKPAPGK